MSSSSNAMEDVESGSSVYDLIAFSQSKQSSSGENDNNTGKLINKLLPLHKDRLYYAIVHNKDIERFIIEWINRYTMNKDESMLDLIQLFVDIAGYQHINLKSFLEMNELKDIVAHMEKSYNPVTRAGKYLLKMRAKNFVAKHNKLNNFIGFWLEKCLKSKLLFDSVIFRTTAKILVSMGNSKCRSIRHTGVYFTLKYQTTFIQFTQRLITKIQDLEKVNDAGAIKKMEKLKVYYDYINEMVTKLYRHVFEKNWNFFDYELYLMRKDCIVEVFAWIEIMPDRYLQENYIKFIVTSVNDEHKCVRASAFDLLIKMIEIFHDAIKPSVFNYIASAVCPRMDDVDSQVGTRTVELLTLIAKYTSLSPSIKDLIFEHIYDRYYPKAYACAKFFIERTERRIANIENQNEFLLKKLIAFNSKAPENSHPLLVEAFIDWLPALQNLSLYINILRHELDEKDRQSCINILKEVVYLTCKGHSSLLPRQKSPRQFVDEGKVQSMINDTRAIIRGKPSLLDLLSESQSAYILSIICKKLPQI